MLATKVCVKWGNLNSPAGISLPLGYNVGKQTVMAMFSGWSFDDYWDAGGMCTNGRNRLKY